MLQGLGGIILTVGWEEPLLFTTAGKIVLCFLKVVFHFSPGKAEREGLSTSMSADITTFFLLWRKAAVGRA